MGGLRCGQALVWVENSGEGKGQPPSVYGLASVGGPVLPGGCVGLKPPICAPPPVSSFPSPLWGYRQLSHQWDSCSLGPSWCSGDTACQGPSARATSPGRS